MQNPVLSGSHPDPDLIRVGDNFYLATTTFEWLPGVPNSGGNYIPSLSWHDGTFSLVYSVVLDRSWPWMANRSYVTTAPSVEVPWMKFAFRKNGGEWQSLGPELDTGHLSDEGLDGKKNGFTGSFVGMAAQDLQNEAAWPGLRTGN